MAAQSQGIKKLMQAEKEAAQVVASARKSELTKSMCVFLCVYGAL